MFWIMKGAGNVFQEKLEKDKKTLYIFGYLRALPPKKSLYFGPCLGEKTCKFFSGPLT